MAKTSEKVEFEGASGHKLAARMHLPDGEPRAYALFAHCFTCSKDIKAAVRITSELADLGIASLRFDFTGIGESDGDFAGTDFSGNVGDVLAACNFLSAEHAPPQLLIGHSLGGAAVLSAAGEIEQARLVATIGAPSSTGHLAQTLSFDKEKMKQDGKVEVKLAGRPFTITAEFVRNLEEQNIEKQIGEMHKALLVFHAPFDEIVGIDQARQIFMAARHPKSFVSLDAADHLLTNPADAEYVAKVIGAWVSRYLPD